MYKAVVNSTNEINLDYQNGQISLKGEQINWDIIEIDSKTFHLIKGEKSIIVEVLKKNASCKSLELKINNAVYNVDLKDKSDLLLKELGLTNNNAETTRDIKAPMPGLILEVLVSEGSQVRKGDPLLILEAMKMENMIKSPTEGIIKSVKVEKGKSVEKNQILIQF